MAKWGIDTTLFTEEVSASSWTRTRDLWFLSQACTRWAIRPLCNEMYNTGIIPKYLTSLSIFMALPKIQGSGLLNFPGNQHNESTNESFSEDHTRMHKKKAGFLLAEDQFGFRSGIGTREAVSCMRKRIERALEMQNTVYLCFKDYWKVFDRVQHDKLIKDLKNIHMDDKDLRIIVNLY